MDDLREIYNKKLEAGELHPDTDQRNAIAGLNELSNYFVNEHEEGFFAKVINRVRGVKPPKGFYFYGDVGRGKSMVMDLFFEHAPILKKCRVHFHEFMLEVHDFLHHQRSTRKRDGHDKVYDDLLLFAEKIAGHNRLLCFDEFHVKDVADAMILGRLFTALFDKGVIVVMTSNIAPDKLYVDGLQRDRFIPFIEFLKEKLNIVFFSGETDYRLGKLHKNKLYFTPHNIEVEREMGRIFRLMGGEAPAEEITIEVKGRSIFVPKAAKEVAEFTFAELCEQPKSALDYLELVKRFRVFIVKGVPKLSDMKRNETVRFITFIDTIYDHRAHLVISAAVPVEKLYEGEENAETFKRTVSRLIEMQSYDY